MINYNDILESEKGRNITAFFVFMLLLPLFLFILSGLLDILGYYFSFLLLIIYWILFVYLWIYFFKYREKKQNLEKQEMRDAEDRFFKNYFHKKE